jgi:PhnB protein
MPENESDSRLYHSFQAHLIIRDCAKAIDFYKLAFGATERMRVQLEDGRVGHAEIQIGDCCVMMADEHPEIGAYSPEHYGGSPVSFYIYVDNCDMAFFQTLSAGGKAEREPANQPYGDRVAGVLDPFGYKWYIATHLAEPPPDVEEEPAGDTKPGPTEGQG